MVLVIENCEKCGDIKKLIDNEGEAIDFKVCYCTCAELVKRSLEDKNLSVNFIHNLTYL